jgi:hypothetical protein
MGMIQPYKSYMFEKRASRFAKGRNRVEFEEEKGERKR